MAHQDSYYLYRRWEKIDGQDYMPSYPPYYSINGDGTKEKVLKQENDPNCPETDIYRWYESSEYVCVGDAKYKKEYYQVSYDEGQTWQNVIPEVTRAGELISQHSSDCTSSYESRYLTLVAESDLVVFGDIEIGFNLPSTGYVDLFEYSVDDGETWETISYSRDYGRSTYSELIPKGKKVLLKNLKSSNTNTGNAFRILASSFFHLEGNVMSLIYGDNFVGKRTCGYFRALTSVFKGNLFLTNIDNLVLPATSLSSQCYLEMFMNCKSLVTVPSDLLPATDLTPVDDYVSTACYGSMFKNCTSLTNVPRLPATTLSESCYVDMFEGCTSLESIPNDLLPATALTDTCYNGMFSNCISLTNVPRLPAKLLAPGCYYSMFGGTRGQSYFSGCTSLTNVPSDLLPATILISNCYENMFYGCTSLTSAPVLPAETLTSGCYRSMFANCTSLSAITCLATDISASGCTSAWTENVSSTGIFTKNTNMDNWTTGENGIPSGWTVNNQSSEPPVTSMKFRGRYSGGTTSEVNCNGDSVLHYSEISGLTGSLTGITSGEIGDCVATIGGAFYSATTITSVTISNSVHKINGSSFKYCYALSNITIPDSVVYIGDEAFEECWNLRTITIGSGINQIDDMAFYRCSGLTSITINATIPPILIDYSNTPSTFGYTNNCPIYVPCESVNAYKTADVWSNYASRITCVDFNRKWFATYTGGTTSSAECDSTSAISQNEITLTDLASVEIGDCVTSIGIRSFYLCTSLSAVTISNTVTSIGQSAFYYCTHLTSVIIPSGVTSIPDTVFYYCTRLTSVTIPDTVTSIGDSAFMGCSSLTSVIIPSSVTRLKYGAFYDCTGLTSITINATTPPTFGGYVFDNTNNCPIYVPAASVSTYQSASGWSTYASRIQAIP